MAGLSEKTKQTLKNAGWSDAQIAVAERANANRGSSGGSGGGSSGSSGGSSYTKITTPDQMLQATQGMSEAQKQAFYNSLNASDKNIYNQAYGNTQQPAIIPPQQQIMQQPSFDREAYARQYYEMQKAALEKAHSSNVANIDRGLNKALADIELERQKIEPMYQENQEIINRGTYDNMERAKVLGANRGVMSSMQQVGNEQSVLRFGSRQHMENKEIRDARLESIQTRISNLKHQAEQDKIHSAQQLEQGLAQAQAEGFLRAEDVGFKYLQREWQLEDRAQDRAWQLEDQAREERLMEKQHGWKIDLAEMDYKKQEELLKLGQQFNIELRKMDYQQQKDMAKLNYTHQASLLSLGHENAKAILQMQQDFQETFLELEKDVQIDILKEKDKLTTKQLQEQVKAAREEQANEIMFSVLLDAGIISLDPGAHRDIFGNLGIKDWDKFETAFLMRGGKKEEADKAKKIIYEHGASGFQKWLKKFSESRGYDTDWVFYD